MKIKWATVTLSSDSSDWYPHAYREASGQFNIWNNGANLVASLIFNRACVRIFALYRTLESQHKYIHFDKTSA
jgi:hypothetical protein